MLLFVSENLGSVIPESAYSSGTDQLNEGILWHPRLHQATGEASAPCHTSSDSPGLAVQAKRPSLDGGLPAATPKKALAITMTKQMLYGKETPLVGVGLVYKPHHISTEPFNAAYMHLHVWHVASSHAESEDKLNSS